ncbi:MAG: AI-2E family transporter [Cardiobacteriaceae bacterium]|nr:AI-2E family transporter [Cardiobacteriaceae bacterium]
MLFIIMTGWLLHIGQDLLIPILVALIAVYVLVAAADWLARVPLVGRWPVWARRVLVLLGFFAAGFVLVMIIISTAEQVVAAAPRYQENLGNLFARVTAWLNLDAQESLQKLRAATLDKVNLQALLGGVLGSVGSLFGMVTLVAIYMAFLLAERGSFAHKLAVAMPGARADEVRRVIGEVNQKIGRYLGVKTFVNAILGVLSWAVMWWFGVDFAVFWALIIALLNYIPYVGSFLGVIFPVLLTLAQFGSLQTTLLVAAFLSAAQFYIGNVLEPKMVGKQVNLSPFVVLVALSLWGSLWGVAGAILAIPLTSMIAIICAAFPGTRAIAVMLAEDVDGFDSRNSL